MSILVVAAGRTTSSVVAIAVPSASRSTELISASLRLRFRQEIPPVPEPFLTAVLTGECLLLFTGLDGERVFSFELLAWSNVG